MLRAALSLELSPPSRSIEHKVLGTRCTDFASGSLGIIVSGTITECGRKSTIYWMLIQSVGSLRENLAPALQKVSHLASHLSRRLLRANISCSSYLFTLSLPFFWICYVFRSGFLQDVGFFQSIWALVFLSLSLLNQSNAIYFP